MQTLRKLPMASPRIDTATTGSGSIMRQSYGPTAADDAWAVGARATAAMSTGYRAQSVLSPRSSSN